MGQRRSEAAGRRRAFRVLALIGGALLGILGGEVAVRIGALDVRALAPLVPVTRADPEVHVSVPDIDLLYRLKPGAHQRFEQPETWGVTSRDVTINALGHRDPPRSVEHRPDLRILAIGGSNTYGAVVGDQETWPLYLEAELRARTGLDIEVWNLGVPGYMTRQNLRLLELVATRYRPDLVLLQNYNIGPRFFLDGDDIGARIAADPTIWGELLLHVPRDQDRKPTGLFRRSALVRLAVTAWNRLERRRDEHAHVGALTQMIEGEEAARLRALRGGALKALPVVAFITPAGAPLRQVEESGIPWFDMRDGAVPDGPEAVAVHPGREIHRWYATTLAMRLIDAGCVPREGACFGAYEPRQ